MVRTPIVTKQGDVVGERVSPHPAAAILKDAVATFSRLVAQLDMPDLLAEEESPSTPTQLQRVS